MKRGTADEPGGHQYEEFRSRGISENWLDEMFADRDGQSCNTYQTCNLKDKISENRNAKFEKEFYVIGDKQGRT